jgi:hypothetical protein
MTETEMVNQDIMTEDDIHDFGINIVAEHSQKDGFELVSINKDRKYNPQIVAKKNDQLAFIVVRTACYPNKGSLDDEALLEKLISHADQHSAICYFASVGIANSKGRTEDEISIPLKGAGFYVSYEGLLILTRSDRVKTWDEIIVPIYEQEDFSSTCVVIAPDFELINAELIEYFSRHPDDLYKLHPRKFEMLLEAVFRNQGYRAELGPGWSDGGVDLRLYQKDSIGEICTLVQAKRYKPTSPIRLEAVASLAALVDDEKANRGLFVTTSRFLPGVQKFAEKQSRRVTLANSIDIARWCEEVARRNRGQ